MKIKGQNLRLATWNLEPEYWVLISLDLSYYLLIVLMLMLMCPMNIMISVLCTCQWSFWKHDFIRLSISWSTVLPFTFKGFTSHLLFLRWCQFWFFKSRRSIPSRRLIVIFSSCTSNYTSLSLEVYDLSTEIVLLLWYYWWYWGAQDHVFRPDIPHSMNHHH